MQEVLAELYGHGLEAYFGTAQLREGLTDVLSPAELHRIIDVADATGDRTVSYERGITLLGGS
ncbi:hypothetical protein [Streptomyces sp. DSM 40907]|uniref:hypothetical protein n=1 Tax=Streptomyces kutzneri TaxID=3051179 RepID=UPI0028D6D349|nr:hypothetical protein [Streptomyces sp. DSM 40907]